MTLRKEDGVINTNYNNHAGLGRKMSLKKKRRKEREISPKQSLLGQSPGSETHAGLEEPKGTVK